MLRSIGFTVSLPLLSVNVADSATSVTVTVKAAEAVLSSSSVATSVTLYTLSPPASAGASKSRATIDTTPVDESTVKSPASVPLFNDTTTTEIYSLSLLDALPI